MTDGQLFDEYELLAMRANFISKLKRLRIFDKVHPNSRFYQAFDLIEEWGRVIATKGDLQELLERTSPNRELHFALQEVGELMRVLPYLDENDTTVKKKIIIASSGTLSPLVEKDTRARDAQFELALYGALCKNGYNAQLCEPNPDIQVICGKNVYNIECKRVFAPAKLDRNFSKASRQLRDLLNSAPDNHYGIVALSVGSSIAERAAHLDASSLEAAKERFNQDFKTLVEKHALTWKKPERLIGDRMPAVLLHMLMTVMDHNSTPPMRRLVNNYCFTDTIENSSIFRMAAEELGRID